MRQARRKHLKTHHDWLAAMMVGWLALAVARIALALLISVLSAGLLFWMKPEQIGSIAWVYLRLLSPAGWIPFLLWGGLAGVAAWHFRDPVTRKGRVRAETACLLMLFAHESLWSTGTGYRVSFDISKFLLVLTAEFWMQTWPLLTVWFLVFGTTVYLLPVWLRHLHKPIRTLLVPQ